MPDGDSSSSSDANSWQVSSGDRLARPTESSLVEQISYDGDTGRFTRRFLATPGHRAPRLVQILDSTQLKALLAQLQAQLPAETSAQNTVGLREFISLIETALKRQESE